MEDIFFDSNNFQDVRTKINSFIDDFERIEQGSDLRIQSPLHRPIPGLTDAGLNNIQIADYFQHFFHNQMKWNHINVQHNLYPPILIDSVATSFICNLYNPNGFWDLDSGQAIKYEKEIAKTLSTLAHWTGDSAGTMCFGGKACFMYAMKLGLNRIQPDSREEGVTGRSVVITGTNNHYIIDEAAAFMGIGSKNVLRVENDHSGAMSFKAFKTTIDDLVEQNINIATIILSGGDTINLYIDPIKEICAYCDQLVEQRKLITRPFIHLDSVVSWSWLMFEGYDFIENKLEINKAELESIEHCYQLLAAVKDVDSFGADFHKTGFVHYQASMFMTQNKSELFNCQRNFNVNDLTQQYGHNFIQFHTIEHSRSSAPIISTWYTLNKLGKDGFRTYIADVLGQKNCIKDCLLKYEYIKVLNQESNSFSVVLQFQHPNSKLELEKLNKINYTFHEMLSSGELIREKYIFSFLPAYICLDKTVVSAIRIYLSSNVLTREQVDKMTNDLLQAYNIFINKLDKKIINLLESGYEHVPK